MLEKPLLFRLTYRTVICFLLSQSIYAGELRHLQINADSTVTSDDFSIKTLDVIVRNHRRELIFPFENASNSALDWGLYGTANIGKLGSTKFSGRGLSGVLGRKYNSEFYLEASLGFQALDSDATSKSLFAPSVKAEWAKPKSFSLQWSASRIFMYQRAYLPGPITEGTSAWSFKPYTTAYFNDRLKFLLRPEISWPDDGNKRFYIDVSLMYGVSLWPTWLWVGVGSEKLSNSKPSSYWSPSKFYSYGLRLEVNGRLVDKLSGSLGLNLNKLKEEDLSEGDGHYFNAGLVYGERNDQNLKLEFTNIKSVQSNSEWESNSLKLIWNYFW